MRIFGLVLSLLMSVALTAETIDIQILHTTDIHGHLRAWDYTYGRPARYGLARLAPLIKQQRAANPNTLLVDTGDTIQGSPLETVYQRYASSGSLPLQLQWDGPAPTIDPTIAAMNALGFDAMAVGNHEYNYGLKNLNAARKASKFPWLSANTLSSKPEASFPPYIVKTLSGVKIALIGIITPGVPGWEKPEHYAGYRFERPSEAVKRAIAELKRREKPDAIIVLAHSGLDRDIKTGARSGQGDDTENEVYEIASECPGVDAILFGHSHQSLKDAEVNGVVLLQPRYWAGQLGRLTLTFDKSAAGTKLVARKTELLEPAADAPEDAEIVKIAEPYHRVTERYLNTPVAEASVDLQGREGRYGDSALIDAIHAVQLHYSAGADVSLTALFNANMLVKKGKVTIRELLGIYPYENEIYTVEADGKTLRLALENGARYLLTCPDPACSGSLINRNFPGFNYESAQGVEYEIDLTQPVGSRIRNLRFRGAPLRDEQPLKVAISNYRYGGSGGFSMWPGKKVLAKSGTGIQDLLVEYYTQKGKLPEADNNWRVEPEAARKNLAQ